MLTVTSVYRPVKQALKPLLEEPVYNIYSRIARFRKKFEYIFILSHMRSGSSLLTHLLADNPEICGYGETGIRYSSHRDFDLLIGKVMYNLRQFPRFRKERYVMDKLLHDQLLEPDNVHLLSNERCRVIFLIREPQGALASLVNLEKLNSLRLGEKGSFDYYVARLATIERYAEEITRFCPCLVVTYDQILHQTTETLDSLRQFLELSQPLRESYHRLPTTGRLGVGDGSSNIRSGYILRGERSSGNTPISPSLLNDAQDAFERCRTRLTELCTCVGCR
jgi:hypothetical protein